MSNKVKGNVVLTVDSKKTPRVDTKTDVDKQAEEMGYQVMQGDNFDFFLMYAEKLHHEIGAKKMTKLLIYMIDEVRKHESKHRASAKPKVAGRVSKKESVRKPSPSKRQSATKDIKPSKRRSGTGRKNRQNKV